MSTDARLATLEATVDDLRRELERMRTQRRLPMRQTHRCPACGGGRVLQLTSITDLSYGGPTPMALLKTWSKWNGVTRSFGPLGAFVCASCMLVEWHAASLDGIEHDGTTVIEHRAAADDEPESGPYR